MKVKEFPEVLNMDKDAIFSRWLDLGWCNNSKHRQGIKRQHCRDSKASAFTKGAHFELGKNTIMNPIKDGQNHKS